MTAHYGRVVGGGIQFDAPPTLPEGARVTVLVQDFRATTDPEMALDMELVDEGLLAPGGPATAADFLAYHPVPFQGEPLSKTIVEERR